MMHTAPSTRRRTSHSHPTPTPSASSSASPSTSMCTSRAPSTKSFSLLALAALASLASVAQAALYEPPNDQVMFGAWIDTMVGYSDTPTAFNTRLGYNTPIFQIAQDIPLPAYNYVTGGGGAAPENLIETSATDAAVFLTVYPAAGFATVADSDFTALAQQILNYQTTLNRTTFLRYAPEMQGTWNLYGQQPTEFIASWKTCYSIIKSIAPETIMVWAPNTPQGYPYGETNIAALSAADQAALDTNGDGTLSSADDALAPYYPGDAYVDWIGLSLYYKGTAASDVVNVAQTDGYCAQAINGVNPQGGTAITNWYQTYCAEKPAVACMFSESGAAYHVSEAGTGSTQAAIQLAWINDCVTNRTMLAQFPRLKLIMQFEYEKTETSNENTQDLRDYRLTNDTGVLAEFQAALATMGTTFSWANSRAPPTSISSPGAAAPITNSAGSTVVQAITQTVRARPTTFPSLFGVTSGASQMVEIIELSVLVASGVAGALAVMKYL